MLDSLKRYLLPLTLLLALLMAGSIDLLLASVPMVRSSPRHPVYSLGSPSEATALAAGEQILRFGPCLFGLYPGALAFSSPWQARDFLGLQGLPRAKWRLFQLSGDYRLDVTDGVLNKTLRLGRLVELPD